MNDIKNRSDISVLVNTFYAKIRENELLGPVFNSHIPQEEWPKHLRSLTDFWETNLFGIANFKGNPSKKHINVDKNLGHTVSQIHFSQWIQLWFETIDELYKGQRATKAKESARKMATGQFLVIWNNRPDQTKLSK